MHQLLDKYRKEAFLAVSKEDTLQITKTMRASSPPATANDLLDNQNPKRNRPFRRVRTNDILQEVETMLFFRFCPFIYFLNNFLYNNNNHYFL